MRTRGGGAPPAAAQPPTTCGQHGQPTAAVCGAGLAHRLLRWRWASSPPPAAAEPGQAVGVRPLGGTFVLASPESEAARAREEEEAEATERLAARFRQAASEAALAREDEEEAEMAERMAVEKWAVKRKTIVRAAKKMIFKSISSLDITPVADSTAEVPSAQGSALTCDDTQLEAAEAGVIKSIMTHVGQIFKVEGDKLRREARRHAGRHRPRNAL